MLPQDFGNKKSTNTKPIKVWMIIWTCIVQKHEQTEMLKQGLRGEE